MTSPLQYCFNKIAMPGSPLYYSLMSQSPDERNAIVAIAAFYEEVNECLYECQEPALAQTKLNWWRREVAKLELGQPEHPVSQVLQTYLPVFQLPSQFFADLIDGVEEQLSLAPFPTQTDLTLQVMRTVGIRESLISKVVSGHQITESENIYQLAWVLALADSLQNMRKQLLKGLVLFSEDEMAQYRVSAALLHDLKTTPEIRQLLNAQQAKAQTAWDKAQAALTPQLKFLNRNLIIRCQMALALMEAMQEARFEVLEQYITLTPIHRWWIAFKVNWKLRKGK